MKKSKQIFGVVLMLCGLVGLLICAALSLAHRFQNPDMTNLRFAIVNSRMIPWIGLDVVFLFVGKALFFHE